MLRTINTESLIIRGARVIDPFSGRDEIVDVAIVDGMIVEDTTRRARRIDATGWILCPGLMDIHVHLREPGQTHKETIATGTAAAAAGGFTFVATMPNTEPPLDHPDTVRFVLDRARSVGHCEVAPVAAITVGRQGRELTDFAALLRAGAVAFSDDGNGVEDESIMRAAMQRGPEFGAVLIQHCEFKSLSKGGVMNLGDVSSRLGFPGLDPRSEEAMIERDIALCRETGCRYHVAHVSTARSVQLVRQAKEDGLPVSAEVSPHHLLLTDEACAGGDPNTKMHPPLRTALDVEACRRGLLDGTIDCIASDHAPHTAEEKAVGFLNAPPGIVGLETAVGLAARAMIESALADWPQLLAWFTSGPAAVLNLARPEIEPGHPADLTMIDPQARWTVDPRRFLSRGRNTPFAEWKIIGRPVGTIRGPSLALIPEAADRLL
jgi:dihydroorotase